MKQCPYCGKEYPDEIERCLLDDEVLVGGPPVPPILPAPVVFVSPPAVSSAVPERQMRIIEVALVCLVAVAPSLVSSTHAWLYPAHARSYGSSLAWGVQGLREVAALALVWYVLLRRGKTFADLGMAWKWADLGWSVLLGWGGMWAFDLVYSILYHSGLTAVSERAASENVDRILFGGGFFAMTMLFQFVNPFFEELIVRAYLMTEIKWLTNSAAKAVLFSTLLQSSYHFYQGTAVAVAHGASFLLFAVFYAKTGRIAPVILAHLYADVGPTLEYVLFRQPTG